MSEFKTHAVLCLSNWGGVAIEVSNTGEAVRYKWYEDKPSRWCKVYYNRKGEPYFQDSGQKVLPERIYAGMSKPGTTWESCVWSN